MNKMSRYRLSLDEVEKGILFLQGMYSYFGEYTIDEIWNDDPGLAEHLKRKYRETKVPWGHDYFRFYCSLDYDNKRRLIDWYNLRVLN